ncbi:ABC transporter permease [Viridibacillus sp. YIM B01967]|uniref:ABC transporter permease n=1 Tax=Viridibacillus soli TaxID=2798301 RepID=A0ABS1H5P5_9BACL|nr:ABC transporter permease [Viridibacillus soli]MBK3494735.1 ABC transporter permease [Viridibacillus soli]
MTVFRNNIKRIFRKKRNLIFMLILPIVFALMVIGGTQGESKYKVGYVDKDNTEFTRIFKKSMKEKAELIPMKKSEIQDKLINSKIDYALVIDKGFTDKIIQNEDVKMKAYSIKESNESRPFELYSKSFLNASKNIAAYSKGDSTAFYNGLAQYQKGNFSAEYKGLDSSQQDKEKTLSTLGFLAMSMVFLMTSASTLILEDKKSGVFTRYFSTPLTKRSYMVQNIASFIVLSAIQIIIIFRILVRGFKVDLVSSSTMFAAFFVFSIVCVSLGVGISMICQNVKQANAMSALLIVPMCMLGGVFWPRNVMPEFLQTISNFVPTTWFLRAVKEVLNGGTLASINIDILVMLAFALLFFLIIGFKRVDVAKG